MSDDRPHLQPMVGSNPEMLLVAQHMAHMAEDIRELRKEINNLQRPNYQLIIAFLGFLVVGGAGLWGLAIKPTNEVLAKLPSADFITEKFSELAREQTSIAGNLEKYATKDDLNRLIIDIDRRLPRK